MHSRATMRRIFCLGAAASTTAVMMLNPSPSSLSSVCVADSIQTTPSPPPSPHDEVVWNGTRALQRLRTLVRHVRDAAPSAPWPPIEYRQLPSITSQSSSAPRGVELVFVTQSAVDGSALLMAMARSLESHGTLTLQCSRPSESLIARSSSGLVMCIESPNSRVASAAFHGTANMMTSTSDRRRIVLRKDGALTQTELEAVADVYRAATVPLLRSWGQLATLGLRVYAPRQASSDLDLNNEDNSGNVKKTIVGPSWDDLGGYASVKREIAETVVDALKHSDVYDEIAQLTRGRRGIGARNRPRAVLFEGPPGTGKTSAARIIASEAGVPLVVVPLESLMSKWYGESEKVLAQVFDEIDTLGDVLVFIDEIDSIASSRSSAMHEASRRVLAVLLQRLEGLHGDTTGSSSTSCSSSRSVLIGATNRKQDLDDALVSRFDVIVRFGAPSTRERSEIFGLYAQQLDPSQRDLLANEAQGMTGRDIRDSCAHAERAWASKLIKNPAMRGKAPPLDEYLRSVKIRRESRLTELRT